MPYHFLERGDVAEQMHHFLKTADPPFGWQVVIDHEPDGDGACASIDELVEAVRQIWALRPHIEVTIYSGHLIKEQLGDTGRFDLLDETSLWIAQYTTASAPTWPKQQWPQWSVWQYTDSMSYESIAAPVDSNRWNGTADELVDWLTPPDETDRPVVTVSIGVPAGVDVRVTVNGEPIS